MSKQELAFLSANEVLVLFRSGELSPVDLLDVVIERAEAIESSVNPFADKYFDEARHRAKRSEESYRVGTPRPLEGVPLLIKDSSPIKGIRATVGSLKNAQNIDHYTDPSIDRLLTAGANFFARSTCPEFCWLFTCHSKMWGVTRNPWRLDITPGGSSGGSAAALAAGATTIATGSDSTGSIRQPAAQCGVVGFKSPYGRNPLDQYSSFDPYVNVGPMTRSVFDAALMQNVMSGPHALDHNSVSEGVTLPTSYQDIRGLKIAFSMDLGYYEVDDDVRRETKNTLDALNQAGAQISEINIDWASEAIKLAHASEEFLFENVIRQALAKCPELLSDYVPQLYETASAITPDDYRNALQVAGNVWSKHMGPLFQEYDVLITPGVSCPEIPAEHWQKDTLLVNGKELTDTDTAMTALFNMFNRCPVLSVPAGMTERGLPVGIQIVGRPYDDVTVFNVGAAVETFRPWSAQRPEI